MRKNNALINEYKNLRKQIYKITPEIYAGIALALHREYGWGFVRFNRAFVASQEIWNECVAKGVDMAKMCSDETGIDVRRSTGT